jgi:hypothetical protein
MNVFDRVRERLENSSALKHLRASFPRLFDFLLTLISTARLPMAFGLLVALVCWFAFFGVVQDYLAGDPLVRADLRVLSFLRTLREPAYNSVMLFFT